MSKDWSAILTGSITFNLLALQDFPPIEAVMEAVKRAYEQVEAERRQYEDEMDASFQQDSDGDEEA